MGNGAKLFDDSGGLVSNDTKKFFQTFIDAYAVWIATLAAR